MIEIRLSVIPWPSRLGVGLRADNSFVKPLILQKPEAEEIYFIKGTLWPVLILRPYVPQGTEEIGEGGMYNKSFPVSLFLSL